MSNVWSEKIKIRAFMVDKNRKANLVTIQNLCQEVAGNHAHTHQLGYADMQERGMAWVLNRLKIKVLQYPEWMQTVEVKTWVSVMQPFSHRHFQITLPVSETNEQEIVLANAYTIWIPIDIATKRPKRLTDQVFPLFQLDYDCAMPEKLSHTVEERNPDSIGKGIAFPSERIVQYSDLDMLGHVNNAKYAEWLLDDFYKKDNTTLLKSLDINYLSEVFEGSVVQIFSQTIENHFFYSLKNKADGKEVCRALLVAQ